MSSSLTAATVAYVSGLPHPDPIPGHGPGIRGHEVRWLADHLEGLGRHRAPSISITALLGPLPLTLAVLAIVVFGVETKKKQLESITAEELVGVSPT